MWKKIKDKLYFLKVWYQQVFLYPQEHITDELDYDRYAASRHDIYWKARKRATGHGLNNSQTSRVSLIASILKDGKNLSILDIGCGEGGTLLYLKERLAIKSMIGLDSSEQALAIARESGIETHLVDITKSQDLPQADVVLMLEVLEHLPVPEKLLRAAYTTSNKHVFFSFPNSGYFLFRLRLLFGKFPMQWRTHPGEHLRFWTMKDVRWWLRALGYTNYRIIGYKGIPVVNHIWPSMFAAGLLVELKK